MKTTMKLVTCPACNAFHSITKPDMDFVRCPDCQTMVFQPNQGPSILIAHGCPTISQQIGITLKQNGFYPLHANKGNLVVKIMEAWIPKGLVLDVAIEEIPAFQIIDHVRMSQNLSDTRIILVASVYNHSAYKRNPKSLYGADDYIEQHHIHDMLPVKLSKLADFTIDTETQHTSAITQRMINQDDPKSKEQIVALAHSIVCDIALYHQNEIEDVLHNGDIEHLSQPLDEGRRMLSESISAEQLTDWDPIQDAFNKLLDSLRKNNPRA